MEQVRKPQRAPHYDYSLAGAYFFTVCVEQMKHRLAKVEMGEVQLKKAGEIVQGVWAELPDHYPAIELDEFVIMPNHIHGLVWIKNNETVREGLKPSPTQHGLTEIIRGLKTFSARRINEEQGTSGQAFWQRSFYDHVINDEADLEQHRSYIQNNPLKWSQDKYFANQSSVSGD